jgi:hypothetical protein
MKDGTKLGDSLSLLSLQSLMSLLGFSGAEW